MLGTVHKSDLACLGKTGLDGYLNAQLIGSYGYLINSIRTTSAYLAHPTTGSYILTGTAEVNGRLRWCSLLREGKTAFQKQVELGGRINRLLIPYNRTENHWGLVEVDGSELEVKIYDSDLPGTDIPPDYQTICKRIREWVAHEDNAWSAQFEFDADTAWPASIVDSPQQTDGYNCGVFMLHTARSLLLERDFKHGARTAATDRLAMAIDIVRGHSNAT
jgi:hypothetical protein